MTAPPDFQKVAEQSQFVAQEMRFAAFRAIATNFFSTLVTKLII